MSATQRTFTVRVVGSITSPMFLMRPENVSPGYAGAVIVTGASGVTSDRSCSYRSPRTQMVSRLLMVRSGVA